MANLDPQPGLGPLAYLIPALEGQLPVLLDEVGARLRPHWPEYARFLAESLPEVNGAAAAFIRSLVAMAYQDLSQRPATTPGDQPPDDGSQDALFEEIGRLQWRQGLELTSLLSAYQVGARVAWKHVSSTALEVGVDPAGLAALAEAVFVFVEGLSSASARGYVLEQSEAVVSRERLREEVAELLLSDRSDSVAIRAAAARAGWPLPREAAVILVEAANEVGRQVVSRLPWSCLPIRRPGLLGAIVPDPAGPGRRHRLAAVLAGAEAVVGRTVPLELLPASVRIAADAAELRRAGLLTADPIFADEHLDAIIVHRDPRLLTMLRQQCLAPLADLAPNVQQRLGETLGSWLRHMGDRRAIAAELHVHPQTVRYRLGQLRERFGAALDDPTSRARLTLVLAWGAPSAQPPDVPPNRAASRR